MTTNTKVSVRKFIRGLSVYTIVIALLSFIVMNWVDKIPLTPSYLFIIIFMFAITVVMLWLIGKSMEGKLSRFANVFMLLNFGKLLLYTLIIFLYAYLNREDAVSFIVSFFIYYLLYTGFEIFVLLRINQQK